MKKIKHNVPYTKFILCIMVVVSLLWSDTIRANASQPGIWNAGGTTFTMLFPEDSASFKKVQMQEEQIYIQLYKGFAVVKGTYLFKNTSTDMLQFKMGYPVNGIYSGGSDRLNHILLDSLSAFKIKSNKLWLPLENKVHQPANHEDERIISFSDNWRVWSMYFLPEESQHVTVYFIVSTNQAGVHEGYNRDPKNAFIYLLESGNVWHQPIENGQFYVQLMNDLKRKDVHGIAQGFDFQFNEAQRTFYGQKTNFSPTPNDNLVVTYAEEDEAFDFNSVLENAEKLFSKIDEFSQMEFEQLEYANTELGDPYSVKKTFWGSFSSVLMFFVMFAPTLILIISAGIIIWLLFKWYKIKSKKNK